MITVPKLWPGDTIVCIGSGPSLTQVDVDLLRGHVRTIAVNDAYRLAPWADVLYACDEKWWKWQARDRATLIGAFAGLKYGMQGVPSRWVPEVQLLRNRGEHGLEPHPSGLRHGRNSGYAAINLAVHLGAARIVLLGYDMKAGKSGDTHFFGAHHDRTKPPFSACRRNFPTLVSPLKALGIQIVNASRTTALSCFERGDLEQVLDVQVAA